jgi:hypothetical protein
VIGFQLLQGVRGPAKSSPKDTAPAILVEVISESLQSTHGTLVEGALLGRGDKLVLWAILRLVIVANVVEASKDDDEVGGCRGLSGRHQFTPEEISSVFSSVRNLFVQKTCEGINRVRYL